MTTFLPRVTGQSLAKQYFQRCMETGRLSHSYLFVGPEGSGKRAFARELCKAFSCATGSACGECRSCVTIEHGNHPLVEFFGPPEGKLIIDIDTVRTLCERTHYKSAGIRVAVLEQAELLNEPAANALLKTLEEPPGTSILILIAQSAGSLLPTIVSRCHRILFTGPREGNRALESSASDLIREAALPGFFARWNPGEWLDQFFGKEEQGTRRQLRRLLEMLLEEWRGRLRDLAGLDLDLALRLMELLLQYRQDLDRNVNAELILEKLLRTLRRPA